MGKPVILVENILSTIQFPSHVVVANEEATGNEVWRVATGRRSPLDKWTPTTANQDAWVKTTCDRVRACDMLAIDRGHNLAGAIVRLELSNDNFTTTGEVFAITLPSTSAPGALDDAAGVRTEEGAWVKRFPLRTAKYWRVFIDAMGAGLRPEIVGLWLGLGLELDRVDRPLDDDRDAMLATLVQTGAGYEGSTQVANRRTGTLRIKLPSPVAYDAVRYHLQGHFARRRPAWILHDAEQADRALLAVRPPGEQGFGFLPDWGWRRGDLTYVEWDPA